MAKQEKTSTLVGKYGARLQKAVAAASEKPPETGRQGVPAGITNGIARITKCGFGQYKTGPNQGEFFFRAEGVVVEPETIIDRTGREVPVAGMVTSVMEAVCDTKVQSTGVVTTLEEHVEKIENHMKLLGAEPGSFDGSPNSLESVAAAIQEAQPYFRFSTSVRKALKEDQPDGVWENWYGVRGLENYEAPSAEGFLDDQTAVDEPEPAPTPKAPSKPATGGAGNKPPVKKPAPAPEPEPEPEPEFNEFNDGEEGDPGNEETALDDIIAAASAGDDDAIEKLGNMALEAGMTAEEVEGAESWEAVGEYVREHTTDSGDDDDSSPFAPGMVVSYAPIDPKTKKPVKKPIQAEIITLDEVNETATLKNLETGKPIMGPNKKPLNVPVAELTPED